MTFLVFITCAQGNMFLFWREPGVQGGGSVEESERERGSVLSMGGDRSLVVARAF